MVKHVIGDDEWYRLNKLVCAIGCDWPLYLIEGSRVIELICWCGAPKGKPLWFAMEYEPSDGEKYYKHRERALVKRTTIFKEAA